MPHKDVYTRLYPSKVHGVGIIAITDIPKGTYIFKHDKSSIESYFVEELNIESLSLNIQQLYKDFCVFETVNGKQRIHAPDSFNNMTVSWYLNHSDTPNVACDDSYDFYAIRDIKEGEELFSDYNSYSEC